MIDVPHWVQVFVLVGIALVVIVVPIRILYEMTKDSRDRSKRFQDLSDRLREKFGGVEAHRTIFGMSRIEFKHEGRPATVYQPADDEIMPCHFPDGGSHEQLERDHRADRISRQADP